MREATITVNQHRCQSINLYWLLLEGFMFEVAGLTVACEVQSLRPG